MTYEGDNVQKQRFLVTVGHDLRDLRERAGLTCEQVASVLNTTASRDRISKVERGVTGIDMLDYLRLMWFYRDLAPNHPAVELARVMLPNQAKGRVRDDAE